MKQASGFGLIEVLVALAVLAMLVVAGVFVLNMPEKEQPSETTTVEVDDLKVTDTTNSDIPTKIDYGTSLSPKSIGSEDFTQFFETAATVGSAISWAGDSAELDNPESAPYVLFERSRSGDFLPILITDHHNQGALVEFAEKYTPAYIGVGNEVNLLDQNELDQLVAAYPRIVSDIKLVSPSTVVFPIFQLERIKGLNGGLFGGVNNPEADKWSLLSRFPNASVIGFTTYPGLIYKSPEAIPADYYTDIRNQTEKPVLFTEIGWPSRTAADGWESTSEEQAEFVELFFGLAGELQPRLALWSFLYDQPVESPFDSMGLIERNGTEKPAFETWKLLVMSDEVTENK